MKKFILGVLAGILIAAGATSVFAIMGNIAKHYPDADYTAYYADHMNAMTLAGVVSGYDNGNFGPNDAVTRAQAVTMLDQFANKVVDQKISEKFGRYLPMFQGLALNTIVVSYEEALQLAQSGLFQLAGAPADITNYSKFTGVALPNEFEIYIQSSIPEGMPFSYYLHSPNGAWYGLFYFGGKPLVL